MTAAAPQPPKPKATESDLDAIIAKIDQALPKIHALAKSTDTPPTGGFKSDKIEKTKRAFQEMSGDSLLTGSGEDVRVTTRRASRPPQSPTPQRAKQSG